MENKVHIIAA